jgi:hypothetical protein
MSTKTVKAELSLCLTKNCAMKACGGAEAYILVFLASALVGVVGFRLRPIYSKERDQVPIGYEIG